MINKVLLILLLLPSLAYSQDGSGTRGGGNARVCFDDPSIARKLSVRGSYVSDPIPTKYFARITSVEALDLFGAKKLISEDGLEGPIEPLAPGDSIWDYGIKLAHRFDAVSLCGENDCQLFSMMIEVGKKSIGKNISYKAGVYPVNDIRPLSPPGEGCVYTTVIVQRPIGAGRREMVIDSRFFNDLSESQHSDLSKAVLIMHEYYLAAANELSEEEVLFTEGVRELVARSIRSDSTLADLLVVILSREMFPSIQSYLRSVRYPELEKYLLELESIEKTLISQVLIREKNMILEDAELWKILSKLPRWYQSGFHPSLISFQDNFEDFFKLCSKVRCLQGARKTHLVQELNRRIKTLWDDRIKRKVLNQLKLHEGDRVKKFEEILEKMKLNPIFADVLDQEIRKVLMPLIRSGMLADLDMKGQFSRIWISRKSKADLVRVTLDSSIIFNKQTQGE